jgi:hypothetical protein
VNRRHVDRALWYCAAERWAEAGERRELPIMWPRLARWWPWHPAVIAGAVTVLVLVAAWVGR